MTDNKAALLEANRPDAGAPKAAAEYIADMSGNLAAIARESGLDALSFILDMAELEARNNAHWEAGSKDQ